EAGVEGEATVSVVIDARGNVREVAALRSNRPEFEEATLDAVRQWEFAPGMKEGRAVSARIEIPVRFWIPSPEESRALERPVRASWF
ncbi:MAG: energy transducer TonB, partial [Opitutaceae bacterium]